MTISLEGQVAVITGAGGGLGRAYALELARRGAAVVVNDVAGVGNGDGAAADAVVDEIRANGGTAVASHDSVATPDGGRAVIATALERFGTVDAVVHNAGVWRHVPYEDMTPDMLDPVLDVHLRGAFFVTQPAWSHMVEKGYGRLVLTSSGAGAFGREYGANYVAAKAGVLGLGRALALEGGRHGILTNCLLPIAPYMRRGTPDEEGEVPAALKEYARKFMAARLPMSAGPELVAPLVAYLASPACDRTGEAYSAGGGRYARVVTALSRGWFGGDDPASIAEEIAAHIDAIDDLTDFLVPGSVFDELRDLGLAMTERDRAGEGSSRSS